MTMRELIQDPIYGSIILEPYEVEFIDTNVFQRLRRIKQLQSVYFVYPSATHTRFEHSLGTMHLAGYFADALLEPLLSDKTIDLSDRQYYRSLARLWGLFHDLGHGPFSHTFDLVILTRMKTNHEKLGVKLIHENEELGRIFKQMKRKLGIADEDVSKSQENHSPKKFDKIETALLQVIKGSYSADVLDYLLRDSYHAGTPEYGNIAWQRLILTSRLMRARSSKNYQIVLEKRSKPALLSFYISRHQMYSAVYYHRTCRAMDKLVKLMLNEGYALIPPFIDNLDYYVNLDEESLLQTFKRAKGNVGKLAQDYLARKIYWKLAYEHQSRSDEAPLIDMIKNEKYQQHIENQIKEKLTNKAVNFFVDGAYLRETPLTPFGGEISVKVPIYDAVADKIEKWDLRKDFYKDGKYAFWIRVYLHEKDEKCKKELRSATTRVIGEVEETHL